MNKRIQELAEQAAQEVRAEHKNAYWRMQDEIKEDITWREKFAQLVAQRCAAIYETIDNGNAVHGTKNYVEALRREFEVK